MITRQSLSTVTHRVWDHVSTGGWLLGLLFFALSLTPSLIPRSLTTQAILCGFSFAAGYGIGVLIEWLWDYLGLKWPNPKLARWVGRSTALACLGLAIAFLWFSTGWQNSIRIGMGMAPVEAQQPLLIAIIAVLPAGVLIGVGRLLVSGVRVLARWLGKRIPPRVALLGSIVVVSILASTLGEGVLGRGILAVADRFYGDLDRLVGIVEPAPENPTSSGSAQSLVPWDSIGQDARVYIRSGPSAADISALTGRAAVEPLRTYVGLRSADSAEARAALALAEMDRVGAFERKILVLVMPVGTGWVEAQAVDTLEMLHDGDVATVAVQYSYLTSWLSLVTEPNVGVETARELFRQVYARWTEMPKETRPKLYLHGLSLGAYSSAASSSIYEVLGDPYQGAFWVGPPFATENWQRATDARSPDTPYWRPGVGSGAVLRFSNGNGDLREDARPWGPMRTVFLQYPTDPIVFFQPEMAWASPPWLSGGRAPGVSPLLDWFPVVTFLQLALDMALAQSAPIGYGHNYAPEDYLDGWIAVTGSEGWSAAELANLRARITRRGATALIPGAWFRD
jgi:uncharacterized membrane protein